MKRPSIVFAGNEPIYASRNASGADLCANIGSALTLMPQQRILIPTGSYVEIPHGFEGQVRPRSGLSVKHGIIMPNAPGTIDSDYRGEIKVPLLNASNDVYVIQPLERIAQLVICPVVQVQFSRVKNHTLLSNTERGEKGFGSSDDEQFTN